MTWSGNEIPTYFGYSQKSKNSPSLSYFFFPTRVKIDLEKKIRCTETWKKKKKRVPSSFVFHVSTQISAYFLNRMKKKRFAGGTESEKKTLFFFQVLFLKSDPPKRKWRKRKQKRRNCGKYVYIYINAKLRAHFLIGFGLFWIWVARRARRYFFNISTCVKKKNRHRRRRICLKMAYQQPVLISSSNRNSWLEDIARMVSERTFFSIFHVSTSFFQLENLLPKI